MEDGRFIQNDNAFAGLFTQLQNAQAADANVIDAEFDNYSATTLNISLADELDYRANQSRQLYTQMLMCNIMINKIIDVIDPNESIAFNFGNILGENATTTKINAWKNIINLLITQKNQLNDVINTFKNTPYQLVNLKSCAHKLKIIVTSLAEIQALITPQITNVVAVDLPVKHLGSDEIHHGNHKMAQDEFELSASRKTNVFKIVTAPPERNIKVKQHISQDNTENKTLTLVPNSKNNRNSVDCTSSNMKRLYVKPASFGWNRKPQKPTTVTFFASIDISTLRVSHLPTHADIDANMQPRPNDNPPTRSASAIAPLIGSTGQEQRNITSTSRDTQTFNHENSKLNNSSSMYSLPERSALENMKNKTLSESLATEIGHKRKN